MTKAKECLLCNGVFMPNRSNQRYCGKNCQKKASKNAARGTRATENIIMNRNHYHRALDLAEWVYTSPPLERLGVIKEIIMAASQHDSSLRRILTDPKLLRAAPTDSHLFFRRTPRSYKTISQVCNSYVQRFFGISIQTYLKKEELGNLADYDAPAKSSYQLAIPSLTRLTSKNVKCWHKPLSDYVTP